MEEVVGGGGETVVVVDDGWCGACSHLFIFVVCVIAGHNGLL